MHDFLLEMHSEPAARSQLQGLGQPLLDRFFVDGGSDNGGGRGVGFDETQRDLVQQSEHEAQQVSPGCDRRDVVHLEGSDLGFCPGRRF